jgi:LPXTG-motif cell wall-anchored protein
MRVRKLLALTIAMILVLGTFTFGYSNENLSNTEFQEQLDGPKLVDNTGTPGAINYQREEDNPEDPDNLGKPDEIKSTKLFTPRAESKAITFSTVKRSMAVMAVQPNGEYNNIAEENPGYIDIDKTATEVDGQCNLWDIELTLTGIDGELTSDTVLVIDRSGSMANGKLGEATDAAKDFVDLIFDGSNDSNHRIAVVSFAGDVTIETGFSSNATNIKDDIDDIDENGAGGGTHTQAAMRQAGIVLNPSDYNESGSDSTADSQNIILLSDGEATYSYKINDAATHATESFNPSDYGYGDNSDEDYRTTSAVPETAFDYPNNVGAGNSGHTRFENGDPDYYYRHGASAVAEAGFIDNEVDIYTISLQNNAEGDWTLDNIQNAGSYETDDDLGPIYQEIAGSIVFAASDAFITDPLGQYFDIPGINSTNYTDKITVSRGKLGWDNNTETITWDLGKISASDPATMTYQVEMDPSGFGMGEQPTNGHTFVDYTNINGQDARKDFPDPKANMTCEFGELTIIKRLFVDGEEVLEDDRDFEFTVDGQTLTASVNENGTINLLTGDYTVEEINYGDWVPDDSSQDVTVTPNGARVTFINNYTTPDGNVKIIKNIEVEDEAVHEGVKFNLSPLSNGDGVLTGYTDSNGELIFNDLPVGDYLLEEVLPLDFESTYTSQVAVTSDETTEVKVLNNMVENKSEDYEYNGNKIYGYKYNTMEQGLEGWTIELYEEGNSESPIATATTGSDGYYEFTGIDEGNYIVREVMKDGWYNINPIEYNITVGGILGTSSVTHLNDKTDVWEALPDENIEFVAEGRIGDLQKTGEHELNIHLPPNNNTEDQYDKFIWNGNGVPEPFKITFDGSELKYEVGGNILTYTPTSVDTINDLMIRTFADEPNSGIMVNNLKLNGDPIPYTSVAIGNGDQDDVLWMHNFDLTDGFTLEGESVMYWSGDSVPMRSHLAYQIKFGDVANEGEYSVRPFMNDEYADVTVYKEIDGEQVDTDFNFTIYKGTGTEGDVIADTSVDINNPELIEELLPGTYTIAEQPVEGYITPTPYTFDIDSGESLDITLNNIERVPQPEPSMVIEKVADDYSVYVGEDVTYTITVTNTGDVDLDYVYVSDEQLDYSDSVNIPVGGSFSHSITTSYDSTGTKTNTARADYEGEGGYISVEDSVDVEVRRRSTPSRDYEMELEKEADGDFYEVGDTITYTITIENTGDTRLTDIVIEDDMTGFETTLDYLNPGESREFTTTYVAQESDVGDLTNTATAEDDRAGTEEATEVVTVEDIPESVPGTYEMTIEKTAMTEGDIFSGDMVEFTIVVTNTGDEILENILVEDDMVDFEAVIDELAPGESEEFTVMVEAPNIPGPFTNTAKATSTETGTLDAEDTVFVEEEIPLDVPDTGVAPTHLFFGLGALVSGLGVFFTKKRK